MSVLMSFFTTGVTCHGVSAFFSDMIGFAAFVALTDGVPCGAGSCRLHANADITCLALRPSIVLFGSSVSYCS